MNRFLLLVLMIVIALPVFANPQSLETARSAAENFVNILDDEFQLNASYSVQQRGVNEYFVFNLSPVGFVVVSADNDVTPVIAYSFKQSLENEFLEENMLHQMLSTDLEMRRNYYSENPVAASENHQMWQNLLSGRYRDDLRFQQWPAPGSTITDGWIEKQWNQSGVYNQMCPLDNSGARSVVGCVATAMSLIMDYHEYIGNPVFTDADDYSNWGGMDIDDDWESRDFPPFPELNDYLQDVAAHYAAGIPLTADDKAALNFSAGVSVEMGYSSSGSGTWTSLVPGALLSKYGYDTAEYFENEGSWFFDILIENMQSMKPTELTIYQAGYEGGHAINCDGYNTNDFYHLNFGWGTSNNACWYTLPQGMPSGYSILTGAAMNIEGGYVPFAVQGDVDVNGTSPDGAYITFDGPRIYECIVDEASGNFEVPAMVAGTYTITAVLEERAYFQCLEDVIIDEDNHFIQINLGAFDQFTGNVLAPIAAENATVTLILNGEVAYTGTTDSNGNFAIPEVLPASYFAAVSLAGNYFSAKTVEVTLEDQTEDFVLEEYSGNMSLSYAGANAEFWNLIPNFTTSCGIKITSAELTDMENDVISGVRFKAPINDDEGDLFAQVWIDEVLMSETEIPAFTAGEWLDIDLDSFVSVVSDQEYFVGYKIYSTTGTMAYRDSGPRVSGKGAYFKNGNWIELAANNDFNFCIEAKLITQECGSISGLVDLNDGNGNLPDAVVRAGKYSVHPDENGDYSFDLKTGNYNLSAELFEYETDYLSYVNVTTDEITDNQDFVLNYAVGTDEDLIVARTAITGNYPNPFNPSTSINFSVSQQSFVTLEIYNLKGQQVKQLISSELNEGQHTVVWNGIDEAGKAVSSGLYFAKMKAGGRYTSTRKLILLK
jgi:Peptidase C10 family/Spi protease inhibitor/FlgD Ig-like domain